MYLILRGRRPGRVMHQPTEDWNKLYAYFAILNKIVDSCILDFS